MVPWTALGDVTMVGGGRWYHGRRWAMADGTMVSMAMEHGLLWWMVPLMVVTDGTIGSKNDGSMDGDGTVTRWYCGWADGSQL